MPFGSEVTKENSGSEEEKKAEIEQEEEMPFGDLDFK